MKTVVPYSIVFYLTLTVFILASPIGNTQDLSPDDDYDVLVIPVGASASAPGTDFRAPSLALRGLVVDAVPGLTLAETPLLDTDTLTVRLKPGEGIRLLSAAIPVSASTVHLSAIVSATGDRPQQAAMALFDANDLTHQSVSMSFSQEFPYDRRDFSLEYQRKSDSILFLIQLVGPALGESTVTVERLRVLSGYRDIQFALGSTALTAVEHFGQGVDSVTVNTDYSTPGGGYHLFPNFNRTAFPKQIDQSLLMETQSPDDNIQITIPLQQTVNLQEQANFPVRMVGRVYIRRIAGGEGIFTVALFSGITGSGGYANYPVSSIPSGEWLCVESQTVLSEASSQVPLLILQLQGGQAKIAVDDASIHLVQDSIHFWDANIIPKQ